MRWKRRKRARQPMLVKDRISDLRLGLAMPILVLLPLLGQPVQAVDVEPDDAALARILLLQSRAKIAAEDYRSALDLLREADVLEPANADIHNLLGFTSRKLGRFAEAHRHYAQALTLDPEHLGALEYWGELHLQEGNMAGAEALLLRLVQLCPEGCEELDELEAAMAGAGAGEQGSVR